MGTATTAAAVVPALDETGILLAEVDMFLKKSRERAAAVQPPAAAAPMQPPVVDPEYRIREPEAIPEEATLTERQLRALSRKHLFTMIRDLEKELLQVKEEKANILLAYQAGRGPRV